MKKVWVLVLLISLGLNLGFVVRLLNDRGAEEGKGGRMRGGEIRRAQGRWSDQDTTARRNMFARRMEHIADVLDLRQEQREEFEKGHAETGRLLMQKRALIGEKRDLLHSLVTSEEVDQDRIRRAIAELGQEQAVLDSLVAETVLHEMAVLDPDQRAQYLEMLSFAKDGRGGWRGGRGQGRPRQ